MRPKLGTWPRMPRHPGHRGPRCWPSRPPASPPCPHSADCSSRKRHLQRDGMDNRIQEHRQNLPTYEGPGQLHPDHGSTNTTNDLGLEAFRPVAQTVLAAIRGNAPMTERKNPTDHVHTSVHAPIVDRAQPTNTHKEHPNNFHKHGHQPFQRHQGHTHPSPHNQLTGMLRRPGSLVLKDQAGEETLAGIGRHCFDLPQPIACHRKFLLPQFSDTLFPSPTVIVASNGASVLNINSVSDIKNCILRYWVLEAFYRPLCMRSMYWRISHCLHSCVRRYICQIQGNATVMAKFGQVRMGPLVIPERHSPRLSQNIFTRHTIHISPTTPNNQTLVYANFKVKTIKSS